MMKETCPVCGREADTNKEGAAWLSVDCLVCGTFSLSDDATVEASNLIQSDAELAARASHGIRKVQSQNPRPKFLAQDLKNFIEIPLPTISEQADNLLVHFANLSGEPGVDCDATKRRTWQAVVGAKSKRGVAALCDFLEERGFIKKANMTMDSISYRITVKGWQRYEELQKSSRDSTIAFMAMQFGDPELDQIVDETFRKAVAQTGFRLQKITDQQRAGLIDDQLRVQIRRARFLIADLTHANNGAYWEAGFAEGLGIPVIYTCKQSVFDDPETKPHFDTNHYLTVPWDPAAPETAAEKFKATIRATLPEAAKMEDE